MIPLLLACSGPDKPDGSPAESATDTAKDTAADSVESADSPTKETGDTGETGDSIDTTDTADTAETGETADTGEPPGPWEEPGDAIPGWPDADCSEAVPGQTLVITWPSTLLLSGEFLSAPGWGGPHLLDVQLRDCDAFACPDSTLDTTLPYTLAVLDGSAGDVGELRGTGWYGPDAVGVRTVSAAGRTILGDVSNTGVGMLSEVTTCLERVYPGELRGEVRVEILAPEPPLFAVLYATIVLRFPFHAILDDHAAFDTTLPDNGAAPAGFATARYLYDIPYDDAWPWELITDEDSRQRVYERYTPYNME